MQRYSKYHRWACWAGYQCVDPTCNQCGGRVSCGSSWGLAIHVWEFQHQIDWKVCQLHSKIALLALLSCLGGIAGDQIYWKKVFQWFFLNLTYFTCIYLYFHLSPANCKHKMPCCWSFDWSGNQCKRMTCHFWKCLWSFS